MFNKSPTACKDCEHVKPIAHSAATCLHPDGPVRVYLRRWLRPFYPKGCPLDPNPKVIRQRPKKKKGPKQGAAKFRPEAKRSEDGGWSSHHPQELRAPTKDE